MSNETKTKKQSATSGTSIYTDVLPIRVPKGMNKKQRSIARQIAQGAVNAWFNAKGGVS